MRAMILAAGRGQRMHPLTDHCPKPLLRVGDKPLIVYHIEALAKANIREIVINLAYLGAQIETTLGQGERWGVNLKYSHEDPVLETAGGIVKALPLLGPGPFWVVNGDIWTHYDFSHFTMASFSLAHLILVENPPHHPAGDFGLNEKQQIVWPALSQPTFTYSGMGVFHPAFFQDLDISSRRLGPLLQQGGAAGKISGEYFTGPWTDVGTPERLMQLDNHLKLKNAV